MAQKKLWTVLELNAGSSRWLISNAEFVDEQASPHVESYLQLEQEPRLEVGSPTGGAQASPGSTGGIEQGRQRGSIGAAIIRNPLDEKKPGSRQMSFLLDESVQGETWTLYRQTTHGDEPVQDLSDASWDAYSGIVDSLDDRGDTIEVRVLPQVDLITGNLTLGINRGWGSGCLTMAATDEITWDHAGTFEAYIVANMLSSDWWLELQVRIDTGTAGQTLFRWSTDKSTDGIVLTANILSNANVRLECFGLTTNDTVTTANTVIFDDTSVTIGFGRHEGALRIALDGIQSASAATSGSITDAAGADVSLGDTSCVCTIGEMRLWSTVPTQDVQEAWHDRRIDTTIPGLKEVWRDGTDTPADLWKAVLDSNYNSDSSTGTPTFAYGGEGQPEQQGLTKMFTLGEVPWIKGLLVDSGTRIMNYHHTDAISVGSLYYKGTLVDPADYDVNDPFDGDVTFSGTFSADWADHVRFSTLTGSALTGDKYELLLKSLAFDTLLGPVVSAQAAVTLTVGPPLAASAGLHLPSQKKPYDARVMVERVALGANVVVSANVDGDLQFTRVPFQPFDPATEADARLYEHGNVARQGIKGRGYAHLPLKNVEIIYARTIDVTSPGDLEFATADATLVDAMQNPFQTAEWKPGLAQTALSRQYRTQIEPIPAHFAEEIDAYDEALLVGRSLRTSPKVRTIECIVRDSVPGLLVYGSRVVLESDYVEGASSGLPFRVVEYSAGLTRASEEGITVADRVLLLEQPTARSVPDEIVSTVFDFTATVAQVSDDPMAESADFAIGSLNIGPGVASLQLGFPAPAIANNAVTATARIRWASASGVATLQAVNLYEGATLRDGLRIDAGFGPFTAFGLGWRLASGTTGVSTAEFDLSLVTDLSELVLDMSWDVSTADVRVYGVDYEYSLR